VNDPLGGVHETTTWLFVYEPETDVGGPVTEIAADAADSSPPPNAFVAETVKVYVPAVEIGTSYVNTFPVSY
jgi:hypothetical protein